MLIAFGVLAFGVRVAIQLRRTGKTGLIGLREGAGPVDWLRGILFVCGMATGVAAQLGMGESWRIGVSEEERTDLITGGWFSLCRNPIYTWMIVGWSGIALMVPTWLTIAAVATIAVGLEFQVRFIEGA